MWKALYKTGAARAYIGLASFQADTLKPLILWGTAPWLSDLQAKSERLRPFAPVSQGSLVVEERSPSGKKAVTGKKKALKESSAYTQEFGAAVAYRHAQALGIWRPKRIFSLLDE